MPDTVLPVQEDPEGRHQWRPDKDVAATFTDQLAGYLRDEISQGRLTGRLLSEPEMFKQYGVSRWVIREALDKLKTEGLLKAIPKRGTWVVPPEERRPEPLPGCRSDSCVTQGRVGRTKH